MRVSLFIKTDQPDQLVYTREFVFQPKLLEKAYFIFKLTGLWQQSGRLVLTLKTTEMESALRLSAAQARKGSFLQFYSRNFADPTISEPGTG